MGNEVRRFYNENAQTEWERAEDAYSRIEYRCALGLIDRHFPASGRIIDIGGGPGRYSLALLRKGYAVTLLDLAENHLAIATERIREAGLSPDAILQGDARDLSGIADSAFDAALLMGPLYHLHEASARSEALRALYRVLKPGGIAIAAYLNAWGTIRTGVSDFPQLYEDADFLNRMLDEGGVGIWYWSNPERAQAEVRQAGFEVISNAGAEGCVGGIKVLVQQLAESQPAAYENLVQLALRTSEMPQFRDSADHLLLVIRKGEA